MFVRRTCLECRKIVWPGQKSVSVIHSDRNGRLHKACFERGFDLTGGSQTLEPVDPWSYAAHLDDYRRE